MAPAEFKKRRARNRGRGIRACRASRRCKFEVPGVAPVRFPVAEFQVELIVAERPFVISPVDIAWILSIFEVLSLPTSGV